MKKIVLITVFIFTVAGLAAQQVTRALDSRSDSVHITKHIIALNNIDKIAGTLTAHSTLYCKSKLNNINNINFDLENFIIDSVFENNIAATFNYINANLKIYLNTILNQNDSCKIEVYYHGSPSKDATWGGFYFNGNYAFTMGVGFTSQPHVVGRYLFPCYDNFIERSVYEFLITTDSNNAAVCNGINTSKTLNANGSITWAWQLQEAIPSYLVSVAVAPYYFVHKTLSGVNGNVPAMIACLPQDSAKVNASFAHLQQSFEMLEQHFGAYQWPKVGYSLVPFAQGAMEHATNIHIGAAFVDGTLNYETLIAHELSHHWFGDLATCATAQDMWLNEGFASYCEMLHTEYMYGAAAYNNAYRTNHFNMLATTHINDDGYRAISPMDNNYTYSTTVYQKGADMIHTLRSYLGDSLFFNGIRNYLNQNSFQAVSTATLNQSLNAYTGKNLNPFFDGWILQAGFANFTIDSSYILETPIMTFENQIFVRQRKHKNNNYLSNVPLRINCYYNNYTHDTRTVIMNGQCSNFIFTTNLKPVFICLDEDDAISDASTFDTKIIKTMGWQNYMQGKARIGVKAIVNTLDSCLARIEHHWVAPDRFRVPQGNYVLQDNRYWHLDGINLQNINGVIGFQYSGNGANYYLDTTWIKTTEDKIKLFYRKDARQEWTPLQDSLVTGSLTDKIGNVYAKNIIAGDYAIGIERIGYTDTMRTDAATMPCGTVVPIQTLVNNKGIITIYPNPANNFITISIPNNDIVNYKIINTVGEILSENTIEHTITVNTNQWPQGLYYGIFTNINNQPMVQKFLIIK